MAPPVDILRNAEDSAENNIVEKQMQSGVFFVHSPLSKLERLLFNTNAPINL